MTDPLSTPVESKIKAPVRFVIVGILNTVLMYGIFAGLTWMGVPYLISSAIGWIVAMLNSFLLNRKWTFQYEGTDYVRQAIGFVIVNVIAMGVNLAVLEILVQYANMSPYLGQVLAIGISLIVNFLGCRLIFRQGNESETSREEGDRA